MSARYFRADVVFGVLLNLVFFAVLGHSLFRHLRLRSRALSRDLRASLAAVQEREVALHHQAFHDSLTGLPNRAKFAAAVDAALASHDSRSVAARLRLAIRQEDLVARLGGDEFAVLLSGQATVFDGRGIAERILETLRTPTDLRDDVVRIHGRLGLIEGRHGDSFDDLLRHADLAMYEAKRGG